MAAAEAPMSYQDNKWNDLNAQCKLDKVGSDEERVV